MSLTQAELTYFESVPRTLRDIASSLKALDGKMTSMQNNNASKGVSTVKLADGETAETITVKLSKEKTPVAFENKVKELLEEGIPTREQAEKLVEGFEFELDLYYEKSYGLFAVESDFVESVDHFTSPYSGKIVKE